MKMENLIKAALMTPGARGNWGLPVLFWGEPGVAKCLGRGTPVLMHDGSVKPVEEVREGDLLMGPDSKPRRVSKTVSGTDEMFRVVPTKGAPWTCNARHVLTLVHTNTNEVADVELDKYLDMTAHTKSRLKLFQPEVVDFPPAAAGKIDPYFLGVWLGDGGKTRYEDGRIRRICVSKPDVEIERACRKIAAEWGLRVSVDRQEGKCPTYHLVSDDWQHNSMLNELRELMRDEVRVPVAYKTGSRKVRREVLAGLLDTDGSPIGGGYAITQKSEAIADDVAFIARSLGLRVTRRIVTVNEAQYVAQSIFGDCSELPLRIRRKRPKARKQIKDARRTGFEVESIGPGEYFGFSLDGDGRFLLGDFTVTHNTDRIESAARACGLPCEVLSPGERGEAAFGVIPVPREAEEPVLDENGEQVFVTNDVGKRSPKYRKTYVIDSPRPAWTQQFEDADGAGLVFVDETTTAPPAIQPALLGLIHARRIGGGFLGKRVRVLGAANPVASAAGGYELSPPVANRLGHIDWPKPSVEEWVQWLISSQDTKEKYGDARAIEEMVMANWSGSFAWAKGLVAGFLRARRGKDGRGHLHGMPTRQDANLGRAWPSPRTWEMSTRALAGGRVHGLSEEEELPAFVGAFVGEGPTIELFAYMRDADLPMPEDVLDGKVKFEHDKLRLDRTMAVLSSCTAFLTPQPKTAEDKKKREKRADKMWDIVGGLLGKADDLVVLAIYGMSQASLQNLASAVPVLLKARPVLTAAGIGRGAR